MARPRKTLNEILRGRVLAGAGSHRSALTPPKKPAGLPPEESKIWTSVSAKLNGLVDAADGLALAALCRWSVEHDRILEALRDATPGTKEHTALVGAAAKAWPPLAGLLARFGLDPLSRERIAPPPAATTGSKYVPQATPKRPPTKLDMMGAPVRPVDIDD